MDVKLCEICGNIIGSKVFFLAYRYISESMLQEKSKCRNSAEFREYVLTYEPNIKNMEVCPTCVKHINISIEERTKECLKLNTEYKDLLDSNIKNPLAEPDGNIKDNEDEVE